MSNRRSNWTPVIVAFFIGAIALPARAQDAPLPAVTIGGGLQTSYVHDEPEEADGTDSFKLNSARLYVNGSATKNIKFMFNTEYNGATNDIGVLDAVAQVEFSPKFNVWAGRFLPPSDRANLYGPYYSHHWSVYTDGVQDGYPFVFQGRDNGVAYWGQYGKVKVSAGAFDGASATSVDTVIGAGRVQVDFWDPEAGYYLNGTYYGDKNLLALGVAGQVQGEDRSAYSVDFLMERKVGMGGAVSIEAEWAYYHQLGGYNAQYGTNDGGYILGAYLFPRMAGPGRFELLGKYAHARFRDGVTIADADYDQDTTEINVNYVIKQFNARVMMFVKDTRFDAVRTDFLQFGVGLQLQM
ncbi:MAG TPA: hypothetical protein VFO58_02845 [Vicinamibacterales bacterium]|nr:hypothetical protein [Vicinamibacterales bacterium]